MSFESAAELQKLAVEFQGNVRARLLLRVACSGGEPAGHEGMSSPGAVRFGATRDEWPHLLSLARELGLDVIGVSLHTDVGRSLNVEPQGSLDAAFLAAKEALDLLQQKGFQREVLDIGALGETTCLATFERLASAVDEQVTRWFPAEAYGALQIIGECRQLFGHGGSTLLARIIAKSPMDRGDDVNEAGSLTASACDASGRGSGFEYTLNDGVFGAFSSSLCARARSNPEPFKEHSAHESQPCRLLGPSGDTLDVVLEHARLPEMQVGDWLLWRRTAASANTATPLLTWHYAVEGTI